MGAQRSIGARGAHPQKHPPWRRADGRTRDAAIAFLDALPIAAAVLEHDPAAGIAIVACNPPFSSFEAESPVGSILARGELSARVAAFMLDDDVATQLHWSDGDGPGGRHFMIGLARLVTPQGCTERCVISLIDRTAEVETQRSLLAEQLSDSLTGLPNRVAFEEAVEAAMAAMVALDEPGAGARPAVLAVDLTRFSRINECMGTVAGDELIITVARRLIGAIRSGDTLARIGGNEFGVLIAVRDGEADAREAAARIHRVLGAPFRLSDLEIRVDCAIGCALGGDGITEPEHLVRNAQLALKRAKESGGVAVYRQGEVAAVRRRFSIETELRRAIDNDQLMLAFQPVMHLQQSGIAGFEALARWHHPARGEILPIEFIPVAEECGLIVPLGRWALDSAMRTLARWDAALGRRLPISIAVNVSPLQIARDDMPGEVSRALARHAIDGARLTIELTESAIIHDPALATRVLGALAEQAVTVAMDDFGTGYSNLAYLQKLPIDLLKIDRSFVTPMLADRDSAAIVRAILSLADSLGMRTTAEGVETPELARALAALGCSQGQGYYFARALEADAALAFWRQASA